MAHVLFLKRNEEERKFLAKELKKKGYEVDEISNIREAIDKISELRFDVVVADLDTIEGHNLLDVIRGQVIPPYLIVDKKIPSWKEPYILEASSLREAIELIGHIQSKEQRLMQAEIDYLRHRQPYIYLSLIHI